MILVTEVVRWEYEMFSDEYVSILPDKLEGAPVESDTVAERSCTTRRLEAERGIMSIGGARGSSSGLSS